MNLRFPTGIPMRDSLSGRTYENARWLTYNVSKLWREEKVPPLPPPPGVPPSVANAGARGAINVGSSVAETGILGRGMLHLARRRKKKQEGLQ